MLGPDRHRIRKKISILIYLLYRIMVAWRREPELNLNLSFNGGLRLSSFGGIVGGDFILSTLFLLVKIIEFFFAW